MPSNLREGVAKDGTRRITLAYPSQRLSENSILRGFQRLDRLDALAARYKAGYESVLGRLVKLRDQMLRELLQQQGDESTREPMVATDPGRMKWELSFQVRREERTCCTSSS